LDATLSIAIELEGHCYRLRQSDDFREGVEAFHATTPAAICTLRDEAPRRRCIR
jgi:hypothetical protein